MSVNQSLRAKIFERDNYTCQYCGDDNVHEKMLLPAHIRTACLCGDDSESNLITLCRKCYRSVPNKEIMQKFETAENAKIFGEMFKQRVNGYGYYTNYIKKVFSTNGLKLSRPQIDRYVKENIKNDDDFARFKTRLYEIGAKEMNREISHFLIQKSRERRELKHNKEQVNV